MEQTEVVRELFQWVMGLASTVATAVAVWIVTKFRANLAMLTRHEEAIRRHDEDLGLLAAMKLEERLRMIAELETSVDQVVTNIGEMREEHKHTEAVQDRIREDIGKINVSLSEINTHLLYLRKERSN